MERQSLRFGTRIQKSETVDDYQVPGNSITVSPCISGFPGIVTVEAKPNWCELAASGQTGSGKTFSLFGRLTQQTAQSLSDVSPPDGLTEMGFVETWLSKKYTSSYCKLNTESHNKPMDLGVPYFQTNQHTEIYRWFIIGSLADD
jgi:hypothetical protein